MNSTENIWDFIERCVQGRIRHPDKLWVDYPMMYASGIVYRSSVFVSNYWPYLYKDRSKASYFSRPARYYPLPTNHQSLPMNH